MLGNILIRDISNENKPRERLIHKGSQSLSDIELLAILLNSGGKNLSVIDLSSLLLKRFGSLRNILEADIDDIKSEKHVGLTKAAALKAVGEIAKRAYIKEEKPLKTIKKPLDAFNTVKKDLFAKKQEMLYLLSLDSRKKLVSKDLICIGSVNETIVPVREIYKKALEKNAVFIILIHNHPSNNCEPSLEDIKVTNKVSDAGKIMGVTLLDHIVTTNDNFTSIKSISNSQI